MTANLQRKHLAFALCAALTLGATPVVAADIAPQGDVSQPPIVLAQATPSTTAVVVRTEEYPAMQRGLRRAMAEGPDALRRYVWRTRMIYNWYIVDFAQPQ